MAIYKEIDHEDKVEEGQRLFVDLGGHCIYGVARNVRAVQDGDIITYDFSIEATPRPGSANLNNPIE